MRPTHLILFAFLRNIFYFIDFNLPAVFMPTKSRDLNMYNPKALRHFHATGLKCVEFYIEKKEDIGMVLSLNH